MKKFAVIVLLTVIGFGVGYLIFGQVNGEFIPINEMFKSRGRIESGVANAFLDLSGKRMSVILSTVIGLGVGFGIALGAMGKKNKGE